MKAFEKELTDLINRHSMEGSAGDTPDHMLARFLVKSLGVFAYTVRDRDAWFGRRSGMPVDGQAASQVMTLAWEYGKAVEDGEDIDSNHVKQIKTQLLASAQIMVRDGRQ